MRMDRRLAYLVAAAGVALILGGWGTYRPVTHSGGSGGGGSTLSGAIVETEAADGTSFTVVGKSTLDFDHAMSVQYRYRPGPFGVLAGNSAVNLTYTDYFADHGLTHNESKLITSPGIYEGDSLYVRVVLASVDSSDVLQVMERGFRVDHGLQDWMWRLDDSPAVAANDSGYVYATQVAATAAGRPYDRVFTDTDGTSIKFGSAYFNATWVDSMYPNMYMTNHSEYTYNPADECAANQRFQFLWFDLSELPAGCQIESAMLFTPAGAAGIANTGGTMAQYPAPYGISARLDTIATDLRMLDHTLVRADPSRMNLTWNRPRAGVASAWSPTLVSRRDWNDFGPRAANTIISARTAGQTFRLDLTDAVQQFIDSGRARNGPFVYTLAGASGNNILSIGREFGTNPQFVVRFRPTKTEQSPWDNSKIPFVFAFDDAHDEQATYAAMLDAVDYPYSLVISGNYAVDGATRLGIDNIKALYAGGADIVLHSLTHPDFGGLNDGQLKNQLYRTWWATVTEADMDSTATEWADFAWPVAGGDTYGIGAVKQMIRMGYRAARAAVGNDAWDADLGTFQPYSWSEPFNKYAGATNFAGARITFANADSCRDLLRDYIDEIYSFTGKGALVAYYHNTGDLSIAEMATLLSVLPEFHESIQMMSFEDMMDLRLSGAALIDPGTATFAGNNWRRTALATAAANWDSLSTAGETWADSVWVGPK